MMVMIITIIIIIINYNNNNNNNNNKHDNNNHNNNSINDNDDNNRNERCNLRFFFFTIAQLRHKIFPVARAQSCAKHVQHKERLSRAACVPLGTKDSSAIKFDSLNRIYLNFILLAEPLTDEEGEEIGVPGENP